MNEQETEFELNKLEEELKNLIKNDKNQKKRISDFRFYLKLFFFLIIIICSFVLKLSFNTKIDEEFEELKTKGLNILKRNLKKEILNNKNNVVGHVNKIKQFSLNLKQRENILFNDHRKFKKEILNIKNRTEFLLNSTEILNEKVKFIEESIKVNFQKVEETNEFIENLLVKNNASFQIREKISNKTLEVTSHGEVHFSRNTEKNEKNVFNFGEIFKIT